MTIAVDFAYGQGNLDKKSKPSVKADCVAELSNSNDSGLPVAFDENGRVMVTVGKKASVLTKMLLVFSRALYRPLNIHNIEKTVGRLKADQRVDVPFWIKLSEAYGQKIEVDEELVNTIPKTGPLVVFSNHPMNGKEGIAIGATLSKVRSDVVVVMTPFLKAIPGIGNNAIFMNPDGSRENVKVNRRARLEIVEALRAGKCVVIFPSGEVSLKNKLSDSEVMDSHWKPTAAKILGEANEAQVLLFFVNGQSSHAFQVAKKLEALVPEQHKKYRLAISVPMHIRELGSRHNENVKLNIGPVLSAQKLAELSNVEMMQALREATYGLKESSAPIEKVKPYLWPARTENEKQPEPIADEIDRQILKNELDKAVSENRAEILYDRLPDNPKKSLKVYFARGSEIPETLKELGRLREVAFRPVGEGTGRSRDNDRFDDYYYHLVVWDKAKERIIGAYRMGRVDQIIRSHGTEGVYTRALFDNEAFLKATADKTIEMGRSFVLPEFQRHSPALPVLWRAIGQFLVKHPWYTNLIGPMTISGTYTDRAKFLMIEYLRRFYPTTQAQVVHAKNPVGSTEALLPEDIQFLQASQGDRPSIDDVDKRVKAIEGLVKNEPMGVPPLVGMYGKLGPEVLAVSIDPDFNNGIDGLILVDLPKTNPVELEKYMGKDEAHFYLSHSHERPADLENSK